ncbi:MAG: adenylate kinase [Candidatus Altiarchaeota archaeon]
MNLVMLGPPGSGKGTQTKFICDEHTIPHISTGDILRDAIKKETALGLEAKSYIENGELVPDAVIVGVIKERLKQADAGGGFVLDGFPRNLMQAEALDSFSHVDSVVEIEVPDDVIVERLTGRRVCPECGSTYHIKSDPPKNENSCDQCGSKLSQRKDDNEETIRRRLAVYHEQTEPLKQYYKEKGLLHEVDGTKGIEEIQNAIADIIEED